MRYFRLIIISIVFLQSIEILAQDKIIVKRNRQHTKVEFLERLDSSPIFEYGSENINIAEVSVSSSNENRIGLLELEESENTYKRHLIIFDQNGEVIYEEDSVLEFSWNTSGDGLVLTKGEYNPDGLSNPQSWKVIDFSENISELELEMESYYPFNLEWIRNDRINKIYFRSNDIKTKFGIVEYDVNNKLFTKTSLLSTNISPDGKYVAVSEYESMEYGGCEDKNKSCFKIINVKTGNAIEYFSSEDLGEPFDWISNKGHNYLFMRSENPTQSSENIIYDVENTKVLDKFNGRIMNGLNDDNYEYFVSNNYLILKSAGMLKIQTPKD